MTIKYAPLKAGKYVADTMVIRHHSNKVRRRNAKECRKMFREIALNGLKANANAPTTNP